MNFDLNKLDPRDASWSVHESNSPDGKLLVRRNDSVTAGHPELSVKLGCTIPFKKPSVGGYPDPDENDAMGPIEDQIISAVTDATTGVHVLTLTNTACRELVFYVKPGADIAALHRRLREQVTSHDVQCMAVSDPKWQQIETYTGSKSASKVAFSNSSERMAFSESPEARFSSSADFDQIGEYRSFNPAAALAFVLGLGSMFALVSFMSWVVPLVGVAVGALALWLATRRENMGGKFLAWTGIFLSLLFLSMAVSQFISQRQVIYGEAEVIGRRWLKLVVEGEDKIAHQAMMHPANRQARGFSVDEYYEMDKDAQIAKEKIFTSSPAKDILGIGKDAKIDLIKNHSQAVDLKYGKLIFQTYRVEASGKRPIDATLIIARSYKEELNRASWIVADIKDPDDV